jgi:hypothetical protein
MRRGGVRRSGARAAAREPGTHAHIEKHNPDWLERYDMVVR